jgi:hypothetical protein
MDMQRSRELLEQAARLVDQAADELDGAGGQAHLWLTLARRDLREARSDLDEAIKELARRQESGAAAGSEQLPRGEVVGPDDPDLGWRRVS